MARFSDIDRRFQPKPPATIRLECLNCGCKDDTVRDRRPFWFNISLVIALCDACGRLSYPTAADLIKQIVADTAEYYRTHS